MDIKSIIFIILVAVALFGGSYLWRQQRDNEIEENKLYAFALIHRKSGLSGDGRHWFYRFKYKTSEYEDYWPTHTAYRLNIGDYTLVKFSSINPALNKPIYRYKLRSYTTGIEDSVWTKIPENLVISGRKDGY